MSNATQTPGSRKCHVFVTYDGREVESLALPAETTIESLTETVEHLSESYPDCRIIATRHTKIVARYDECWR